MGVTPGMRRERVGVFGGTFDPPHMGHVAIVEFLLAEGLVDRVLIVPTGQPWLRMERPGASAEHRLAMTRLAFDGHPGVEVVDLEVKRAGPTYTVDTLTELQARSPHGLTHVLVMGIDAARTLPRWHDHERLAEMCELLIVGRPGGGSPSELPDDHPVRQARYVVGPQIDISATAVRHRLANGEDMKGLVSERVEAYIRSKRLYETLEAPLENQK